MNNYTVHVFVPDPKRERSFKASMSMRASSPHYAVRQVVASCERRFPRGWQRLELEVTR